ncbi:uncharacterized protein LY79DRAFT_577898 [Colletotrichum navitas]|uniref:Uncharacterized protein n=1 Tax=Colletotrichum navitas TaxID=681940 RepID=A0AAD8V8J6_9PEZI|nr:uncharacterized protein LY79DRAFT_577898 [Colletotrichum navitas]KAK1595520.1 hypothetical protein LY79DRAFT_577898 [Colletotrichum navitas]
MAWPLIASLCSRYCQPTYNTSCVPATYVPMPTRHSHKLRTYPEIYLWNLSLPSSIFSRSSGSILRPPFWTNFLSWDLDAPNRSSSLPSVSVSPSKPHSLCIAAGTNQEKGVVELAPSAAWLEPESPANFRLPASFQSATPLFRPVYTFVDYTPPLPPGRNPVAPRRNIASIRTPVAIDSSRFLSMQPPLRPFSSV